ncbi:MAG: dihydroorotase [Alphaproteobacteria bacterium]|nr:dihydroorotase [Alphaproteobacteria bacterium]
MKYLLKNIIIGFTNSIFFEKKMDILIQNDLVLDINTHIHADADTEIIEFPEAILCPGFVETHSDFGEPGNENIEGLENGSLCAAKGGYTDVCITPNTNPVLDQSAQIFSIMHKYRHLQVNFHPIGGVSVGLLEKKMSEMFDLAENGAVAFSNGIVPIQSTVFLIKCLQYLKSVKKVLFQTPYFESLYQHGHINEGTMSNTCGLMGMPALSEELFIQRDIEIAEYTQTPLHFNAISTKKSLEYIKEAKLKGLSITCSVTPHHLWFDETQTANFNTFFKTLPPLRTPQDRAFLRQGLIDGSIDFVAANHVPYLLDQKNIDFCAADFGINSLEFSTAVTLDILQNASLQHLVTCLALKPRILLNLPIPELKVNSPLCATIIQRHNMFCPNKTASKSGTSPFLHQNFKGNALGIIHNKNIFINKN